MLDDLNQLEEVLQDNHQKDEIGQIISKIGQNGWFSENFIRESVTLLEKIKNGSHKDQRVKETYLNVVDQLSYGVRFLGKNKTDQGQIIFIDEGTGQQIANMKFSGLQHSFLEFKEFGNIYTMPSTALDFQSQAGLLLSASCMVGFTTRCRTPKPPQMNIMNLISYFPHYMGKVNINIIPDFKAKERVDYPSIRCESKEAWKYKILENINAQSTRQPILLVCKH